MRKNETTQKVIAMTQEEKQLLLKDLCARLTYGVKIKVRSNDIRTVRAVDMVEGIVYFVESDSISPFGVHIERPTTFRQEVKPYLRPMSNMTKEEYKDYGGSLHTYSYYTLREIDWLLAHHFDYRGLIEKGLALEAPEGMYENVHAD